ncbi:hypothetical protein [Helicobacter cynogastricus]|uniref:hypothetical protein n=1 Tax=Helicobacter cynogastricus TaxID=329937 RepID=UPI000CF0F0A8|nr:hypothetical protein [Helicobacter cynogastricus]
MQHMQEQMNVFAQGEQRVALSKAVLANNGALKPGTEPKAREWELVNTKITKKIWPWFWGLVGGVCVEGKGFARPKQG